MRRFFVALLLALATGCQSYDIMQKNVFSDEDGNLVLVAYGRSESEHENTFVSPVTGQEMPFHSKLVVRVQLPDGDRFTAWQCMNFQRTGTMYRTDNDEWMILVRGFSCVIYRQSEQDETQYQPVYRGVLCDTPKMDIKKNDKWKIVQPTGHDKVK